MRVIHKYILYTVTGLLAALVGFGQQYNFTHFSEKDGLQNNIIFSFVKDRFGYLWIGTQNGLNRFDGQHFTVFKKNRINNSIPNNTVHALCEDKEGNIWGGTDNGIFCYSQKKNQFTVYKKPDNAFSNNITNITCDAKGDIYTAGIVDLLKFNREKNTFEVLASVTHSKDSIDFYAFGKNCMLKDEASNGIWLATSQGLLFFDLASKTLISHKNNPALSLFSYRNTEAITRSSDGKIWFFDNSSKSIRLFDPVLKKEIRSISFRTYAPDYRVATILEDRKGKLWLSSWNNEFYVADTKNGDRVDKIESGKDSANPLFFWAALEDENGSIWLGTLNGISICTPDQYIYKSSRLTSKMPALKRNVILNIEENPDDSSWWILTANNLVIQYHPQTGQSKTYPFKMPALKGISVISVTLPQIGFLDRKPVIATSEGLWQLDASGKQFVPYRLLPNAYSSFVIRNFVDADSVIYLTDGDKLLEWNKKSRSGKWIQFEQPDPIARSGIKIKTLLWVPGKPLFWAYSKEYLGQLLQNGNAALIHLTRESPGDTRSYFHYADIDRNGMIWVNNKGVGLYKYNPKTRQIKLWTEFDGLADNHFHSIKADTMGNVWLMYFNKVTVFHEASNSFINFTIPYSENYFNYYNWAGKRRDGTVMGSIADEVFEFTANNLKRVPALRNPHLSTLNVSGKDYLITNQTELTLNPDENSLRFKFGFMPDAGIFPHYFEYRLEGIDRDWMISPASNEAVYNNLAPGHYVFHLAAKGQNGAWQSETVRFEVTIKTPFYKSIWFYTGILFLSFSAIYLLYRYRIRQKEKLMLLENKAQSLEKEKALVMYENLKQQLNPHFLFNSLTSLNSLIETAPKAASGFLDSLSKTYRYILKSRDNETVPLADEIRFAENYVKLQKTRFEKGFIVEIRIPEEYHHRRIVPVTLQNLIENAIKHNIIDEESPLAVTISVADNYLVISNNLQKKKFVETSNRQGLANLRSLYSYLSPLAVQIQETENSFTIKIPLL